MRMLTAVLFIAILTIPGVSVARAAPPSLGSDCGVGATIIGTKNAGKVTMGADSQGSCTITFAAPWPKVPSCSAVNETSDPGPKPQGTITTTTTLAINLPTVQVVVDGDVLSYLCVGQ